MNSEAVDLAIVNLEKGLRKYEHLINQLHYTNVSQDIDFQRKYNGFFKMQRRTPEFYSYYYSLLEAEKENRIDFAQILNQIYKKTRRVEASFSSKMLSMIDPNFPVWDKYVLQNLGLKAPYASCKNRIDRIVSLYDEIIDWYKSFTINAEAIEIIGKFDLKYPDSKISNVKKIDLVLWQIR